MISVLACVHHSGGFTGGAITLATEAAMDGPWVMGGERPATHAFLIVEQDGFAWRIDGEPPNARWRPYPGNDASTLPTAMWRLRGEQPALRRVVARARELDSEKYGWREIKRAAEQSAERVLRQIAKASPIGKLGLPLPPLPKRTQWLVNEMVCSQIVAECCAQFGEEPAKGMRMLPDVFPERLAQALQRAEKTWTDREK